ncbi:hypothetical protein [Dyadobacter sp. CY312]|uniref:hypothetical protein n=1 Tax=Dyadobacter sp. CY312 TaxID=2907303 RepID=UPI001F2D0143|nr:hypothetical protein [Dyadobacter sp. CY312]MCE7042299.1 hypothetical protein [Dyadobacter sp. CY312]
MKLQILSFRIILVLISLIGGCKNEEITKQTTFFSENCKVKSFLLSDQYYRDYFARYNEEGLITDIYYGNDLYSSLVYQYEFNNQQLINITERFLDKDYLAFKYEYGPNGIQLIRRYQRDSRYYNLEDAPPNFEYNREVNQVKYIYGKAGKPSSMLFSIITRDTINNINILTPILSYDYEYDEKGNLVKEVYYVADKNQRMQLWSTLYHKYDNNINTLKPLNYLIYRVSHSEPYMFSENNKIGTKEVRSLGGEANLNYTMEYDSKKNVTNDGLLFSDIKWTCP